MRARHKCDILITKKEDERLLGLSSTDKVLLGVLQQNSTLMESFTKSFATMSLDANRRREMAPVHNIARQAGEGISRDLNRNAPENQSTRLGKWVSKQDDELMRDWRSLKEAFVKRFPKITKKGKTQDALSALYGLKQNKRDLDKYFEDTRKIYNSLLKELAEDVAERVN